MTELERVMENMKEKLNKIHDSYNSYDDDLVRIGNDESDESQEIIEKMSKLDEWEKTIKDSIVMLAKVNEWMHFHEELDKLLK